MARPDHLLVNHFVRVFSPCLLICAAAIIAMPSLAGTSVPLVWNPSIDSGVAGYKVYYGVASHAYTNSVNVGNVTNATITGLTQNTTYYFAATAYDSFGVESPFSNETKLMVYPAASMSLNPNVNNSIGQFAYNAFNVSGANNYLYVVQASTNLVNWVAVQTNIAPFVFVDTNASQFKQRFYRTVNIPSPTIFSTFAFAQKPFANGQMTFNVYGPTNFPVRYVVQASTNLVDWVSLQTNTSPFVFVDPNASQFSQRFYRTYYLP